MKNIRAILALAAAALALTALAVALPTLVTTVFASQWAGLHVLRDVARLVLAAGVIVLAWLRHDEKRDRDAPFIAGAFVLLAVGSAIDIVLGPGAKAQLGYDPHAPGQMPLYTWLSYRLVVGLLLLLGALAASRRLSLPANRIWLVIIGPPVVAAALTGLFGLSAGSLPQIVPAGQLAQILAQGVSPRVELISPLLLAIETAIAILYALAAGFYFVLWRRRPGKLHNAVLGLAALVGCYAELWAGVTPTDYSDRVTASGALQFVFLLLVATGFVIAIRVDLRQVGRAKSVMERLRVVDARRHRLEERARLAREMHDGLTQDLWLARMMHGQLAEQAGLPADARALIERLGATVSAAFDESRQMLTELESDVDTTLTATLDRLASYYSDRSGIDIRVRVDEHAADEFGEPLGEAKGQIARIAREAITNAVKHGSPSAIELRLESAGVLRVVIQDDGYGFVPEQVDGHGMGLRTMRERAERIGGRLEIDSAPDAGTTISLELKRRGAEAVDQPASEGPAAT
jgi:signal transduction histidine kinase